MVQPRVNVREQILELARALPLAVADFCDFPVRPVFWA